MTKHKHTGGGGGLNPTQRYNAERSLNKTRKTTEIQKKENKFSLLSTYYQDK